MQKIIVIDNYDSFTYNLVHYLEDIVQEEVAVVRNDALDFDAIKNFERIVLSPGPGIPKESGELMKVIDLFHKEKKILGVCLGHQAIGEYFGAKLKNMDQVFHGVSRKTKVLIADPIFNDLPKELNCGRYHSWIIDNKNFPDDLSVLAIDEENNIMAVRHQSLAIYGVQFHPESILTVGGKQLLKNWIDL